MEDFARKIKEQTKHELDSGLNLPESESNTDSFGNPRAESRPSSFESSAPTQSYSNNSSGSHHEASRDSELILAKLDAIKAEVSHINNRLENLERRTNERKKLW